MKHYLWHIWNDPISFREQFYLAIHVFYAGVIIGIIYVVYRECRKK